MTQYIPKVTVMSEIENRIDRCNTKKWSCPANTQVEAICDNKIHAYKELLSFLNTLKIKDIDLEKEIDSQWKNCAPVDEGMGCEFANISIEQFANIAKHFVELGLNIQKEE